MPSSPEEVRAWCAAARELLKLVRKVPEISEEARGALNLALGESAQLREQLRGQMATLTRAGALEPADMARLKALVAQELERDAEAARLLAQAAEQGLALPPPPARVAFADNTGGAAAAWTEAVCTAAFKAYTWFDFKKLRKSGTPVAIAGLAAPAVISDEVMWKLYQFRRHFVDGQIARLHAKYGGDALLFKSAGSEDIESDLDITVASPGSGLDVQAMRDFNKAVNDAFGRPPGRVFDTNLYARDYNKIPDTMSKGRAAEDTPADHDIAEPAGAMKHMANIDQDVATLMKQRRFMTGEAYYEMWTALCKDIPDKKQRAIVQHRFEEGEDVYLQTAFEKVEAIVTRLKKDIAALAPDALTPQHRLFQKELAAYQAKSRDLVATQIAMPHFLDFLEEHFEDEVMETTDELYAVRMSELRGEQQTTAYFEGLLADHKEGADCATVHPDEAHADFMQAARDKLSALKARAKQAQFTNIIFANEAYVSQGAIKHVVAGKQAGDPEVLAGIEPAELLQSSNEQMADFLKDMKHLEKSVVGDEVKRRRATGEAFVHASKYLARMLEAVAMLEDKYTAKLKGQGKAQEEQLARLLQPYDLLAASGEASAKALQKRVEDQLVRLRKSSTLPGDAKAEVAVEEVKALFRVADIAGLRTAIQRFCLDFNLRVRALDDFRASQAVDERTEKQYFQA